MTVDTTRTRDKRGGSGRVWEGLGDCLYRFGSVRQDLSGAIRLQNASGVTRLNV